MAVRDCVTCGVKGADCFCSLTAETLAALQSLGTFTRFDEGERILYEGDPAEKVYVMCRGRVKLSASAADGHLLIVRVAGPGDVLGLAAALKGGTHKVTAQALEPCEAKAIGRAEFLAFLDRYRDVGRNAALTMAVEYESAMLSARRLALSGSATNKLASVLLDWCRMGEGKLEKAITFRMPLTHEELGNMAGLSRETVTRTLSRFRREGLLEQDGEAMVLLQPGLMESRYC